MLNLDCASEIFRDSGAYLLVRSYMLVPDPGGYSGQVVKRSAPEFGSIGSGATQCALLSERGSEGGMTRDEHNSNTGQDFLTVIRLSFVICD